MISWHPQMLLALEKARRLIARAKRNGKSDGFSRYKLRPKEAKE